VFEGIHDLGKRKKERIVHHYSKRRLV